MTQDQVFDASVACVRQAKSAGLHVAFVTEDTVRAPWPFLERLYRGVQEAGADRLVISDTVGIMTPITFRWFLREFARRIRPTDWAVHCHNDFGLATANTITALEEGVNCPHVCVNGLGERAGNASLEEVAIAIESLYGVKTGLRIDRLYQLSRTVEEISGIPLPLNKALVGYNAFSHEAGIHTHGILRHTMTYEPIQPETLGRQRQMILGKHTGKAALVEKLKERQIALSDERLVELLTQVKRATEAHQKTDQRQLLDEYRAAFEHPGLTDAEFWSLVEALPQGVRAV
jgi:isopropylmalate/homocitrate/citramalate synthase